MARCQVLLRHGLFVADVLYYNGDWAPNVVPAKHVDPGLGKGYGNKLLTVIGREPYKCCSFHVRGGQFMQRNRRIQKLLIIGATALTGLGLESSVAAGQIQLLKDLKPGFWENDTRDILQVETTSETAVVVSKRQEGIYNEVVFQLNLLNGLESHFDFGYPLGHDDNFPYPTSHDMAQHPFFAIRNGKVIFPFCQFAHQSRFVEVDGMTGELVQLTSNLEETPFATWNCADGKVGFVRRSYASESWEVCRFDPEIYNSIEMTTSVPYMVPTAAYWPTLGPACIVDDVLFFSAVEDDGKYVSLYRTDGTSSGTKTVYAGHMDTFGLLKALGKCFFGVSKPSEPNQSLYVTEANAEGATLLADDLGGMLNPFHRYEHTESSSTVYWVDFSSNKIFASDGMTTRTLPPSADPNDHPTAVVWAGNKLYINMSTWNYPGTTLFESDGFLAPTEVHSASLPFADIFASVETTSGTYFYASNAIYFGTGDLSDATIVSQDYSSEKSDRQAVWPFKDVVIYTRSTGSSNLESDQIFAHNPADAYAPKQLTNFTKNPVSGDPGEFLKVGNRQFFKNTRYEYPGSSLESYRTDGNFESTLEIHAWYSKWLGASANGIVYYSDSRLWNDTPYHDGGAVDVTLGAPGPGSSQNLVYSSHDGTTPAKLFDESGFVYFGRSGQPMPVLFRTDGTPTGTTAAFLGDVHDRLENPIYPIGTAFGLPIVHVRTTNTATIVSEIWTANITEHQSTKLWESETPPTLGASLPDGRLVFGATAAGLGDEVMITDGTVLGTTVSMDIVPGAGGSHPREFVRSGNRVFFVAQSPGNPSGQQGQLWVTDGTPVGTVPVISSAASFEMQDNVELKASQHGGVYVRATDDTSVTLLYSNGSTEGTRIVYSGSANSEPELLAEINGFMYLAMRTPELGRELYRTMGHSGGVNLVEDFAPGKASGAVMKDAAVLGNRLMFAADARDGFIGRELYYIDVLDSDVADWQLY